MSIPAVRCRAHRRNGEPCGRYATRGAAVCQVHGAGAPHVREAARQRLEELILPALATLRRVVTSGETDTVSLAAARDILDRTGLKAADLVKVDNTVTIHVSYEDSGLVPPPEPPGTHRNGSHALDAPTGV
jgi:hypothetical protein